MLTFSPSGVEFAYRNAIFPMYDSNSGEINWYRPDPRTIIPLEQFHVSRSLAKTIRKGIFTVKFDSDFRGVMRSCAIREEGTWISEAFIDVYGALHDQGDGHSVEVYLNDRLVGGVYGLSFGGAFMGESMFHTETDASKVALATLVQQLRLRGYVLFDVQFLTAHLARFGAIEISNREYCYRLLHALDLPITFR